MIEECNNIIASVNGKLSEKEKSVAEGYMQRLKKIEELKDLVSNAILLSEKLL